MSVIARILYFIFFSFLNSYFNSQGFGLAATIVFILAFVAVIPPLSKLTRFNVVHHFFFGRFFEASTQNEAEESDEKVYSESVVEDETNEERRQSSVKTEEATIAESKDVKQLIMESLEGALKEFISDPPDEAYSSGDGYFSWYINIRDSEGNTLSEKTGDDFCVNCNVGLLEDVVMNDSTDFTEVEADVRQCFKDYLYQSHETILIESADKVDVSKSYFEVAVFEVVDSGADVWRYYRKNHYFDATEISSNRSSNKSTIKRVTRDPYDFNKLDDIFKSDKEVVMAAVTGHGDNLEYAADSLKADKEVVLAAINNSGSALRFSADNLKEDPEILISSLRNYGSLEHFPDHLKANKKFVLGTVAISGENLEYASDELKADKEIVRVAIKNSSRSLEYASEALRADREIVLEAMKNRGVDFRYIDEKFKADKEVVMAAVQNNGSVLEYASDSLKADKEFILSIIQSYEYGYYVLEHASDEIKSDKEIVMAACKASSGNTLEYASANLRGDEAFVLSVIKSCPDGYIAFPYISESLKEDREFVKKALEAHGNCYEHIAGTFQADKEMVLMFVSSADLPHYDSVLSSVPEKFHKDKDVITAELEHNGTSLAAAVEIGIDIDKEMFLSILKNCISKSDIVDDYIPGALNIFKCAPDHIQADKEVVMFAIEHADTMCAKYASSELLHDRDLLLKCFEKGSMYSIDSFIPDEIRADKEFMLAAAKINPDAISLASKELLADQELLDLYLQNGCSWLGNEDIAAEHKGNKELVLPVIEKDAYYFEYVSAKLKADKDVVMAAVSKEGSALEWASSELQADKEIVLAAVKQDKESIKFASWSLLTDKDFMLSI